MVVEISLALALLAVCLPISTVAERMLGEKDPASIVCDEYSAFLFTLVLAPPEPVYLVAAFLLFRMFDIVKPWPLNVVQRSVKGGLGIMADDFLAALYTLATLWLAMLFVFSA